MDDKEREYEIDLEKLGKILWRKKKKAMALCIAGVLLGFAYPMTQPASYSSIIEMRIKQMNVWLIYQTQLILLKISP